jgi:hypothetical protein
VALSTLRVRLWNFPGIFMVNLHCLSFTLVLTLNSDILPPISVK